MASFLSLSRHFSSRSKLLLLNPLNPRSNLSYRFSATAKNPNFISDQRLQIPSLFTAGSSSSSSSRWSDPSSSTSVSRVLLASLTSQLEKPINPCYNGVCFFRSSSSAGSSLSPRSDIPILQTPLPPPDKDSDSDDSSEALADEIRKNVDGFINRLSDIIGLAVLPYFVMLATGVCSCYIAHTFPPLIFVLVYRTVDISTFGFTWAILLQRSVKPTVSLSNISDLSKGLALLGLAELGCVGFLSYITTHPGSLIHPIASKTLTLSVVSLATALLLQGAPKLVRVTWELDEHARLLILTRYLRFAKIGNSIARLARWVAFVYSVGNSLWFLIKFLVKFVWK